MAPLDASFREHDSKLRWRSRPARLLVAEEMQDREIELVGVLQEGEMAHVRQDEQAGVRDGRGDIFGVGA